MRMPLTLGGLLLAPALASAQAIELPTITVSANREETPLDRTGSDVSVLTGDQIAATGDSFILDSLQRLPGVSANQSGPVGTVSGFALRGFDQNYVRVMVDGIDISDPTGTQVSASLSAFPTGGVGRVEVLKGSQSAIWGGQAVGGVINITSAQPQGPGLSQTLNIEGGSYDTLNGSYSVGYVADRWEGSVTAIGYQSDGFSAADEKDGNTEKDGSVMSRVSASGTFHATDTVDLFGTLFHQYERADFDDFGGPGGDNPDDFARVKQTGGLAGISFQTGAVENRLAVSRLDTERESYSFGQLYSVSGTRDRIEYLGSATVSPQLGLQVGADWTREETTFPVFPTGERSDASEITGIFGQATWTPVDALILTAALRNDNSSAFGSYPTGRLTAAWLVTPDTTLRGSVGTGFRAPSNYELYDPFSGNPDLEPETSVSYDIGITQSFAEGRGQASATLFQLEVDNLIEYVGEFLPPDFFCSGPCRYEQVDGTSTSKGLELAASWAFNDDWSLQGAYTYTDARNPDGSRRDRIPMHDLSLTLLGNFAERWSLAVTGQYAGGVVDNSTSLQPGQFDGIGDYTLLGGRIGYQVTEQAQLYLRVENLFDTEYQTARGFGTSGRALYAGLAATF
ncbi:MAG: TonB-dependent receptor [Amaricoccus sp.]